MRSSSSMSRAEPVLLLRAQRALVEAAHRLAFHELAKQLHDGEDQAARPS